jgi:hypothetical protein
MEAFTSIVAGMVDEVEKRVKECVQVEREKTKTTTTTQSVWQKKGGLSLFGSVVQKET